MKNNPKTELCSYLDRLIHRYLNAISLYKELKSLLKWQTATRMDAFNLGAHFFQLVMYSLWRTVLVELSMLLSDKEQRSLLHWLEKAKEHAALIEPTQHNPNSLNGERQSIGPDGYQAIIKSQVGQIHERKEVIGRIKAQRDKAIAHLDRTYFDNPNAIHDDYPLSCSDIDDLMNVIGNILREHYNLLFGADMRMEVLSVHNVNTVLQYARAFMRARKDSNLRDKGFKPGVYMQEDYREQLSEECNDSFRSDGVVTAIWDSFVNFAKVFLVRINRTFKSGRA